MFGIGMPEMILILAVALIVIGPKKLPDLAKSLGRALGEFKRATTDLKDSIESETQIGDVKNAFKDINKDIKSAYDPTRLKADSATTAASAEKSSAQPAQEKQTQSPTDPSSRDSDPAAPAPDDDSDGSSQKDAPHHA